MADSPTERPRRDGSTSVTAELVSVGSELTSGHVVNTNVCYLSQRLAECGIQTAFHTTVGDDAERMAEVLRLACQRTDVVIVTGGLGPTRDDFTRAVRIAEAVGSEVGAIAVDSDDTIAKVSPSSTHVTVRGMAAPTARTRERRSTAASTANRAARTTRSQ